MSRGRRCRGADGHRAAQGERDLVAVDRRHRGRVEDRLHREVAAGVAEEPAELLDGDRAVIGAHHAPAGGDGLVGEVQMDHDLRPRLGQRLSSVAGVQFREGGEGGGQVEPPLFAHRRAGPEPLDGQLGSARPVRPAPGAVRALRQAQGALRRVVELPAEPVPVRLIDRVFALRAGFVVPPRAPVRWRRAVVRRRDRRGWVGGSCRAARLPSRPGRVPGAHGSVGIGPVGRRASRAAWRSSGCWWVSGSSRWRSSRSRARSG